MYAKTGARMSSKGGIALQAYGFRSGKNAYIAQEYITQTPQGFGGQTTALGVQIETFPTHIAGMPVAVNIGCHVTRHAEVIV